MHSTKGCPGSPGYKAPVNLAYSRRNRSAAVRIPMYSANPKSKRLEFRPPDASCNPYLAYSAMNIERGANLRAGESRVGKLVSVTWQAHHREVKQLMGLVWDFVPLGQAFNFPMVTGVFHSDNLVRQDWGEISGTTGRNTKVTGMRTSGKQKMGRGWVALLNREDYLIAYSRILNLKLSIR